MESQSNHKLGDNQRLRTSDLTVYSNVSYFLEIDFIAPHVSNLAPILCFKIYLNPKTSYSHILTNLIIRHPNFNSA